MHEDTIYTIRVYQNIVIFVYKKAIKNPLERLSGSPSVHHTTRSFCAAIFYYCYFGPQSKIRAHTPDGCTMCRCQWPDGLRCSDYCAYYFIEFRIVRWRFVSLPRTTGVRHDNRAQQLRFSAGNRRSLSEVYRKYNDFRKMGLSRFIQSNEID